MTEMIRRRHLHFDCTSGAAGDMLLAGFLDLGVPESVVRDALAGLGLADRLSVRSVIKRGIRSKDVQVDIAPKNHLDHVHHHYTDIRKRVEDAGFAQGLLRRVISIFDRIARAEAHVHGTTVDAVAFHEVGAVDSIVDVVGCAAAIEWLSPGTASCAGIVTGQGALTCAHGVLPVPPPAVLYILSEVSAPIEGGGIREEMCTPTGAAVLADVVTQWGVLPAMTPIASGYGCGDRDLDDRANVVRVTAADATSSGRDQVYVLETNLDDITGEVAGYAGQRLLEVGALDVWWTPITMKKSRPGIMLSVLASPQTVELVEDTILRETTTLGVRRRRLERTAVERVFHSVKTEFGEISMKIGRIGDEIVGASPEYDDCETAARAHNVAIKDVFAAATHAYTTQTKATV